MGTWVWPAHRDRWTPGKSIPTKPEVRDGLSALAGCALEAAGQHAVRTLYDSALARIPSGGSIEASLGGADSSGGLMARAEDSGAKAQEGAPSLGSLLGGMVGGQGPREFPSCPRSLSGWS